MGVGQLRICKIPRLWNENAPTFDARVQKVIDRLIHLRSSMLDKIDELVTRYDDKRISRRQLIGALLIASATAPLAADAGQQKPALPERNRTGAPGPKDALFRGRIINHVTLSVNDLEESRQFYQALLGASVLLDGRSSAQAGWYDLLIGDSFVSIANGRPPMPGVVSD